MLLDGVLKGQIIYSSQNTNSKFKRRTGYSEWYKFESLAKTLPPFIVNNLRSFEMNEVVDASQ